MKAHTEHLMFQTKDRVEFINITPQVKEAVRRPGVQEGLVLVNAMHITASVYVNDAEPGLIQDFQDWLKSLVDVNKDYRHNLTGEDNAYAHLMRTLMGREAVVAVTGGKLDFGPWEQIYYAEFDGRRKKRVLVKILGE
ncbi:MAG: YjbQ family protein [Candidatus Tectomicrobia bacterium]|uniref:YjbQ family protein n=1 Tax=Tectimicrobiota bacterium TaxID=2528274 RepID=A0A933E859_UNCTE|nr:YjbQ family protein [Candidatus Tectomicrobia bacterium]MBI4251811.1 YjbQ family protein [Candidatus Tectomicrobia bacterium]